MSLMPWQGHHSQEREVKPFGWEFLSLSFVLTHQDNGQLIANLLCRESLGLSLIQKCSWSVWTQREERKNKHKKSTKQKQCKAKCSVTCFFTWNFGEWLVSSSNCNFWELVHCSWHQAKDRRDLAIYIFAHGEKAALCFLEIPASAPYLLIPKQAFRMLFRLTFSLIAPIYTEWGFLSFPGPQYAHFPLLWGKAGLWTESLCSPQFLLCCAIPATVRCS